MPSRSSLIWSVFLVVMALPTVLALSGVLSAWFQPDFKTLSHLSNYVLPSAIKNTLLLVLGVSVMTAIIGVSLAWLTAVCDFPLRRFFVWALILPMAVPGYVIAFAFVGIFEFTGPVQTGLRELFGNSSWFPSIYSYGGVVMALSLVLYPYVYLLVRNAFQTQGRRSLEVGQSLGLSVRASFFRVSLPMARPWIVGGLLLVIMETLADFGTVATFNYDTLTAAIYKSWFSLYSVSAALQVASVLLIFVVIVIVIERYSRRAQQYAQQRNASLNTQRISLIGHHRWLACAACATVFTMAFLLPCAQLIFWAWPNVAVELNSSFWSYVWGSVSLAILAVLVIVGLALLMAFTARTQNSLFTRTAVRVSTLGYALPGTVLAIGLFAPMATVDEVLYNLGAPSHVLQGTMFVMILAYSVRFMAVAYAPLESNFLRITPSIDAVARSLGVSGIRMLRLVHMPIIRRGLLTAMVLVCVDVIKELPITLMTRPFGFNTLAVRVFELSSEGLWERAAIPAIAIVLVGIVPVMILIKRSDNDAH